jgi:hypothetical protein
VDTLFFSSQRSDQQDPSLNLVGFGSRIRNIEAIEIPINNTLVIDEAPLLNTPLHRLKLESRGAATVTFHVLEAYQFIGDQLDAGLAYSVYAKANSNLQLWVQQGRVNLNQVLNASGTSGGLTTNQGSEQIVLQAAVPHDPNGLAVDPQLAYRWYAGDALIAGATAPTYSLGDRDEALSTSLHYQIDYTDGHGLRRTVTSAPIVIDTAQQGQPGSLRVLRTRLEEPQRTRLEARLPGSQADPELVLAHRSSSSDQRPATIQRISLAATPVSTAAPDPAGLVALLDPSESWPNPVTSAEVYDFNKDGRLDTLSWDTTGFTAGPTELRTGLLRGPAAQLALLPSGSIGFVLGSSEAAPGSVPVAALQSLRVNLLNAPAQVGAVVAIALNTGETLSELSALERRQRAITLISNQDHDPAPLSSRADKERQLWLRADQALVLLELNGTTPLDWDGSLPGAPLAPADPLPESGLAGNRLQLSGTSGLRLELEALTTPQTIDSAVSRSQGRAPLLDFRGLDGLTLQASLEVAREAAFTSTMGFYAIDAIDGSIRDPISGNLVNPADPSYHALAMANRVEALDGLRADNRSSSTRNLNLSEARLLAPYALVADPVHGSQTYYAFAQANSDGIGHFRSFGSNVIGLEDQRFGGDRDFDDNLMHLAFRPVTL